MVAFVRYLNKEKVLLEIGAGKDEMKEKVLRELKRRRWRPDLLGFEIPVEEMPALKEVMKGQGIKVEQEVVELYRATMHRSKTHVFFIFSEMSYQTIEVRYREALIEPEIKRVVERYCDRFGQLMDMNLLESMIKDLEDEGATIEIDEDVAAYIERYKALSTTELDLLSYPLRSYQVIGVMFMALNQRAICADEMGLGKDQPLDARILTPSCWSTMGEMRVGSEVINEKGRVSRVVGVYPQGIKEVYEMTFSDGSKARCGREHLWAVQSRSGFQLKTLQELMDNGINKFYIPIVEPIEFREQSIPIHPYFIGAYLGGGHSSASVCFINPDEEILNRMRRIVSDFGCRLDHVSDVTYRITHEPSYDNPIVEILKELKLWEKHIPDCFLFNSKENRLELLRGLMDTDGYIMKDGTMQYNTSSSRLADDVKFIVQSLGGVARISEKVPTYTHDGEQREGHLHYILTINLPEGIEPFHLTRKKRSKKKYPPSRAIVSVDYIGEEETQCIRLDDDSGLYLTDECIVTHNTVEMLATCMWMKQHDGAGRVLIIAPASLLFNWKSEIKKFTTEETTLIDGTPKFRKSLYKDLRDGVDKAFFVLINYEKIPIDFDYLKNIKWDAIFLDEGQKIKNRKAKQTRAVKRLGKLCDCRLVLTGTPLENRLEELYSIMEFVDRTIFGNYGRFREAHYVFGGYKNKEVTGYKGLEKCNRRLKGAMIRRRKEDVDEDLPDKVIRDIELPLTDYQKDVYKVLRKEMKRVIRSKDLTKIGAVFALMRMLCDDTSLVKLSDSEMVDDLFDRETIDQSSAKLGVLEEIVEEAMDGGQKIVIFTQWVRMAHIIEKTLIGKGYEVLYVDGSMGQKEKQMQVWRFWGSEDDSSEYYQTAPDDLDNYRILLTTDSLNYGQNLQCASILVNFEILFNPRKQDQRDARIHRIGADKNDTKFIINFITIDTVEQRTLAMQKEKNYLFDKVVEDEVDVNTNFELIKKIVEGT